MRVILLGTGTPTPSTRRASSSYLVEAGGEVFVFDCGPGSHVRLLEAGIRPTAITQLFITHWHYDHFADLASNVLRRWDQGAGAIPDLNLYGPAPIDRIVDRLFSPDGAFGPDLDARTHSELSVSIYEARGGRRPRRPPALAVREMQHRDSVGNGAWTVRSIEVPHTQPYLRSLAYRLDAGECSFVYTGDFGPTAEMAGFARGADIFVAMCHYITGTELDDGMFRGCGSHKMVAEIARDADVKMLVLSHITEQIDVPGVRERVVHEAADIFGGYVILGEDLMRLTPGTVSPATLR